MAHDEPKSCAPGTPTRVLPTLGRKALAHSCAYVPNWYGRTSMIADPSSMNSTLLLPDPWMDTSTWALRAAAMFLGNKHRGASVKQGEMLTCQVQMYTSIWNCHHRIQHSIPIYIAAGVGPCCRRCPARFHDHSLVLQRTACHVCSTPCVVIREGEGAAKVARLLRGAAAGFVAAAQQLRQAQEAAHVRAAPLLQQYPQWEGRLRGSLKDCCWALAVAAACCGALLRQEAGGVLRQLRGSRVVRKAGLPDGRHADEVRPGHLAQQESGEALHGYALVRGGGG